MIRTMVLIFLLPGPCEIFMSQLEEFLQSRGEELIAPRVDCKEIDFYRLFFEVQERGGYEKVSCTVPQGYLHDF